MIETAKTIDDAVMKGKALLRGMYFIQPKDRPDMRRYFPNGATTVGMNLLLDVMFPPSTSPSTTWYIGLIASAGYSALSAADTMASHAGWAEFTSYSGSNRMTWSAAAASGAIKNNNASLASFVASATSNIRGAFLTNDATKGATAGTLFSTGVQASDYAVTNGATYQVGYEVTLTPG